MNQLITELQTKEISTQKVRYFYTKYKTTEYEKTLLHFNDKGDFPCRNWILEVIEKLNPGKVVSIGETIEISKREFDIKIALPDFDKISEQ